MPRFPHTANTGSVHLRIARWWPIVGKWYVVHERKGCASWWCCVGQRSRSVISRSNEPFPSLATQAARTTLTRAVEQEPKHFGWREAEPEQEPKTFGWWSRSRKFGFRCQTKFLTFAKFPTQYCCSAIFLLRIKEYSLAITFLKRVVSIKTFWLDVRYPQQAYSTGITVTTEKYWT